MSADGSRISDFVNSACSAGREESGVSSLQLHQDSCREPGADGIAPVVPVRAIKRLLTGKS